MATPAGRRTDQRLSVGVINSFNREKYMKIHVTALLVGAVLSLGACSKPAEEPANVADTNAVEANASDESAANYESEANSAGLEEVGNATGEANEATTNLN